MPCVDFICSRIRLDQSYDALVADVAAAVIFSPIGILIRAAAAAVSVSATDLQRRLIRAPGLVHCRPQTASMHCVSAAAAAAAARKKSTANHITASVHSPTMQLLLNQRRPSDCSVN